MEGTRLSHAQGMCLMDTDSNNSYVRTMQQEEFE